MIDSGLDFTVLQGFEPVIEPVAELGENGELVLKGFFPTQPSQAHFEQSFIYEGLGWRLFGFSVNVR